VREVSACVQFGLDARLDLFRGLNPAAGTAPTSSILIVP
jgi:hypothetical protein